MRQVVGYVLFSCLLVLLQTTLVRYLAIETVGPDLVLIWIVYLALREGQASATVAGFLLGLTVDLLSGSDSMIGLAALSKTLAGFAAGFFYNENKVLQMLGGFQLPLITAVVSLVHNMLYFIIFLQGTDVGWLGAVTLYGVPSALYTAGLTLIPMFVFARRLRSQV
jgi:rod shape-determining protein MreD